MSETDDLSDEVMQLEEIFKDRYTDVDKKYMEEVSKQSSDPPVVHPWSARSKQTFSRQMMYRGAHWSKADWSRKHSRHRGREESRSRSDQYNWLWKDGAAPSWYQQGSSGQHYRDRERHDYKKY